MLAAVEDVEHRHGQRPGAGAAEIAEQRQVVGRRRGVGGGERHAEDRVRAERRLVRRPVELAQDRVEARLVGRVEAVDRRGDRVGDVGDRASARPCRRSGPCRRRAARPPRGPRRRAGRHGRPPDRPVAEDDVDLDGRIARASRGSRGRRPARSSCSSRGSCGRPHLRLAVASPPARRAGGPAARRSPAARVPRGTPARRRHRC